jgi:EpsI family protein
MSHTQSAPPAVNLAVFPTQLAEWSGRDLPDMTANEKRALAADSNLLREYHRYTDDASVVLFVAYYGSQRSGDAIHSPKNCLPGAGWTPVFSEVVRVQNPSAAGSSFTANHYVIEKDGVQQDVLYWYQAHGRRFASEYVGKIYLAWDAATKGRTDGALIRITTSRTAESRRSFENMLEFAGELTPLLSRVLPS